VSADKAYASATNFATVESVGGTFFPAFKRKSRALAGGSFEKAYHWFCYNQEEYLQYYHRRSNIESAFSMLKRKFGAAVKAKTWRAMVNETYAKVVWHNIAVPIGRCTNSASTRSWPG
jgi:transposase